MPLPVIIHPKVVVLNVTEHGIECIWGWALQVLHRCTMQFYMRETATWKVFQCAAHCSSVVK